MLPGAFPGAGFGGLAGTAPKPFGFSLWGREQGLRGSSLASPAQHLWTLTFHWLPTQTVDLFLGLDKGEGVSRSGKVVFGGETPRVLQLVWKRGGMGCSCVNISIKRAAWQSGAHMSGRSLVSPAARGQCEGLCAQPHACQTGPCASLVPWTTFQSGDPALAELGCPSLWEHADQQFVPYSSQLGGKVTVIILCGGSYLEFQCPEPAGFWTRDMGLKNIQVAVGGLQAGQSKVGPVLVWLGGSTGEGWTSRGGSARPASCLERPGCRCMS